MTEGLVVDLSLPSEESSTPHMGLGLGFGLGLPLLMALIGCLWFWMRQQRSQQPTYRPNTDEQAHMWPSTGSDLPGQLVMSVPSSRIAKPFERRAPLSAYTVVPELGDTSALNG